MLFKFLASSAVLFFSFHSVAHVSEKACKGFFPKNDLYIPATQFHLTGITESAFNTLIDRAEKLYAPVIRSKRGKLRIDRLWDDGTVNAAAGREGSTWIVEMYGGLARHNLITEEGFASILCHEIGHHIGGAPKYRRDWATNEGQADYFSTAKCMRFMYENENNEDWLKTVTIDAFAANRCQQQFGKSRAEELLCLRSAFAAQSLAHMLASFEPGSQTPQFNTPDKKVVRKTEDGHPEAQCRVDTLFNAATCLADKNLEMGSDVLKGACVQGVDRFGWRPLCWFKPK